MKKILKFELKRGLQSRFFWLSVMIGSALAVLSFVTEAMPKFEGTALLIEKGGFPLTLYRDWMGMTFYPIHKVFYGIIPLLATLPYADSYCGDCEGYIKNIVLRANKSDYVIAKYVSVFVTGGLAVTIPLIVNLLVVAAFEPLIMPLNSNGYFPLGHFSPFAGMFYSIPMAYILMYIVFDFIFGGLIACLALPSSLLIKIRLPILLIPFIIVQGSDLLLSLAGLSEMSISCIIDPAQGANYLPWWSVFVYMLLLFIISFVPYYIVTRKSDTL